MTENQKEIAKTIIKKVGSALIIGGIAFGAFMIFNSMSCKSLPDREKDEPLICRKATVFLWLFEKNDKAEQSGLNNALNSCTAKIRYDDCYKDKLDYLKLHENDEDQIRVLERANSEYKDCIIALKPG